MESRCSSSDFDTPNYRYVAATSMGNHGAAVIARRVRGRFSVTRLLSRLVRFYFAPFPGILPFLPLCDPASPSPAHLTLLFPLDPSFLLAFPTSVARTLLPRGNPSLSFSPPSSFSLPARGRDSPLAPFLALPLVDLTLPPLRPSVRFVLASARLDALATPAHPSYSILPSHAPSPPSRPPLTRLFRSYVFSLLTRVLSLSLSLSLSCSRGSIGRFLRLSRPVLTFADSLLACDRR